MKQKKRSTQDTSSFHCHGRHSESWIRISVFSALSRPFLPPTAFRSDRNLRDSKSVLVEVTYCIGSSQSLGKPKWNHTRQTAILSYRFSLTHPEVFNSYYTTVICQGWPVFIYWWMMESKKLHPEDFHVVENPLTDTGDSSKLLYITNKYI